VGGVLILWLVSPSIQALLIWQAFSNALLVTALAVFLWMKLPRSNREARFDLLVTRNVQGFAIGMTGIAVLSLILTQADKLLVSKLFSLETFAYYSLAWSVANGPLIMAGCVFNVVFPRMSALVSRGDTAAISESYHRGAQLMAVLIFPVAIICSLFSFEIIHLWTASFETAVKTAPILRVLMVGSAFNAVLYLPYALQLSYGWTRLPIIASAISISILIPAMFPMTKHFGLVGAASIWAILNVLNVLISVPIMHRRLLPLETRKYFSDIGLPLLGVGVTATIARLVFARINSAAVALIVLGCLWLASLTVSVLLAPHMYDSVRRYFSKVRPSYV